ncbi:hypothetical protein D3C77_436400 [compost metagenome]
MTPPSPMVPTSAVSFTVEVSMVSVTSVTAADGSTSSFSKSPPVVPSMVTSTVSRSMYTSSSGASTVTVPVVAPAAMLITAPLLRVTVIAVPAGLVSVAV